MGKLGLTKQEAALTAKILFKIQENLKPFEKDFITDENWALILTPEQKDSLITIVAKLGIIFTGGVNSTRPGV